MCNQKSQMQQKYQIKGNLPEENLSPTSVKFSKGGTAFSHKPREKAESLAGGF